MKIIIVLLALIPMTASAQLFRIRAIDYGAGAGNATFENYVNTELEKIEADINQDLPSGQPSRLMKGMADSSVMAGKGIGTDYASNMDVFLIGAGVGVGADLAKDKTTDSDLSGAGVAPGLILGMNLAWMDSKRFLGMDTDRLNVYFNFMDYTHEQNVNDDPDEKSDAELDMLALGVHFRYDWIKGNGSKWLGWGGVKFHFGYEYNKNDITFSSTISKDAGDTDASGGGEVLSGTITGRPVATIETSTHSIPLALSTDVQILYFLSLYTGIGVDYNWGEAEGKGNLNAEDSNINCTGGVCGGGTTVTVRSEANIDASGKATAFTSRAFLGVQFNIPFVRVFVQADKSLGNDVIGATTGVRFVY